MSAQPQSDPNTLDVELVLEMIEHGDTDEASELLESALEQNHDNVRLHILKALIDLKDPDLAPECGRLLIQHSHLQGSDPLYDALVNRARDQVERILGQVSTYMHGRRITDLGTMLENAADLCPHDARMTLGVAMTVLNLGSTLHKNDEDGPSSAFRVPDRLAAMLKRAESAPDPRRTPAPTDPEYVLSLSNLPPTLRNLAEKYLQLTIRRAAGDEEVRQLAATRCFQLLLVGGELEKALTLLQETSLFSILPPATAQVFTLDLIKAMTRSIGDLMRREQWPIAGAALDELDTLVPPSADALLLRAEMFARAGDNDALEMCLRKAAQNPGTNSTPVTQFEMLIQTVENLHKERVTCPSCLRQVPIQQSTCYRCQASFTLAPLLADREDWAGLTADAKAHWWLAEVLADRAEPQQAMESIGAAAALIPATSPAHDALAQLFGRCDRAMREQGRIQALSSLLGATVWGGPQIEAAQAEIERSSDVWAHVPLAERTAYVERALAARAFPLARGLMTALFGDAPDAEPVLTLSAAVDAAVALEAAACVERSLQAGTRRDDELALEEANVACQLMPDSLHALVAQARALRATGNSGRALDAFREIRRRAGESETGIAAQVEIASLLADHRHVVEALEALEGLNPETAVPLRERILRAQRGRPAVAIERRTDGVLYDTLERDENLSDVHGTFAIALRAASRPWSSSPQEWLDSVLGSQIRLVQLIGGLAIADGDPVFGLRMICHPAPAAPERGRLTIALMARVAAADEPACMTLANQLFDVLHTALPGQENHAFWFEPVSDETELAELLVPFEATLHGEIVRREDGSDDSDAHSIYPFLPGAIDLHALCWTLLRQPAATMVSIHLQPTVLYPWEREHLDRGLSTNTALHDAALRLADEDESGWRAFQRAGSSQTTLAHLSQLSSRAYLMGVNVAGSGTVSPLFGEAVAASLFSPPRQVGNTLYGGWEIHSAHSSEERSAAARNCARLDLERWVYTSADPNLGRLRHLVSEAEATFTFRLPIPLKKGVPGVRQLEAKPILPPQGMPERGTVYGDSVARVGGRPIPIVQAHDDRRRHTFVLGKTGSGKSTLLSQMVLQDIAQGKGLCVIDPHGELVNDILTHMPESRADDVIIFDAADTERPIGLNLLEYTTEHQKQRIVTEFIAMLMRMYDPHQQGIVGPRFQHNVRMAMLTAMSVPDSTLIEVVRVLSSQAYARSLLEHVTDPLVQMYWKDQIANTSDFHKSEILDYLVSKFNRFVGDEVVRNIVGQRKTALNFREIMDRERILLVNLSKGLVGPENAQFLGLLLVQRMLITALGRADVAADKRPDFVLYVDEFQNFATELFSTVLSEGRKYGLVAVLANQYLTQLDHEIREAVFGNVGTLMTFRVGVHDAQLLAAEMYPSLDVDDLINLPKYTTATKLLVDGGVDQPFTMHTLPLLQTAKAELAARIRDTSRERYGADAKIVSREILARFQKIGER